VRPFGTYILFEDKLYIQTGTDKAVSKQMADNPKVEICAYKDGAWVRITAEAISDDRAEAKQAALDQFPNLKEMGYATDNGTMNVLCLKNATATFESFVGEKKVVHF